MWYDLIIHPLVAKTALKLALQSPGKRRHMPVRTSSHICLTKRTAFSSLVLRASSSGVP